MKIKYYLPIIFNSIPIYMVWIKCIHATFLVINFAELGYLAPKNRLARGQGYPIPWGRSFKINITHGALARLCCTVKHKGSKYYDI